MFIYFIRFKNLKNLKTKSIYVWNMFKNLNKLNIYLINSLITLKTFFHQNCKNSIEIVFSEYHIDVIRLL